MLYVNELRQSCVQTSGNAGVFDEWRIWAGGVYQNVTHYRRRRGEQIPARFFMRPTVTVSSFSFSTPLHFATSSRETSSPPAVKTVMRSAVTKDQLIDRNELASSRDDIILQVYDELRRLAAVYLQRERTDHTLQPTALVHEAYMRLVAQDGIRWQNREHFVGVAAAMMRRVLVDHARAHKRNKRGGGLKLALAEADAVTDSGAGDLVALDEALKRLARKHPHKSRVVELRFFGGLSIEETARVLGVSDSTVERDWRFARAWLTRELSRGGADE
jgi:RNA polymerase sigma factor (TIGR02999 family)